MTPKHCGGCSDFSYQDNRCISQRNIPNRDVRSTDPACQHWCEVYKIIKDDMGVAAMYERLAQIKM